MSDTKKKFVLYFNLENEKEKIIWDYLENSFSKNAIAKTILYSAIMGQNNAIIESQEIVNKEIKKDENDDIKFDISKEEVEDLE